MRTEIRLPASADEQRVLFGQNDANLRLLRAEFGVKLVPRGDLLRIEGESDRVNRVAVVVEKLVNAVEAGQDSIARDLALLMELAETENGLAAEGDGRAHLHTDRGRIQARTPGQEHYIQTIHDHALVFAIGPAGTGKTYLAVAAAVEALRHDQVKRLVLTRPAVEAGENLGFLPGDMREKVDPYLRPIYDALDDMLPRRQIVRYIDTGVIEVAPLAFMRGRTLSNAFVILDEAQNTTIGQMKMLLTRLGERSRCVVTGDLTQVDLIDKSNSGLVHATQLLRDLTDVAVVELEAGDVVRHRLVADIVNAYENEQRGVDAEDGA